MIKKTIIGIIALAIGIILASYVETFLREQIQNIFLWSTANKINFTGKNFRLFSDNFYYLSFGIAFLIFSVANIDKAIKSIIKNLILSILIFIIVTIGISSFDANSKVMTCTACEDGIKSIHWNEINYELILGISILVSAIPSLISLFKNRKNSTSNISFF